jgi:hypothetical protein
MYGRMYGMVKTTVYLPEELKRRLEQAARSRGTSEAEVIRDAIDAFTLQERPRPRLPLFHSGRGDIAERVDELLAQGFGRD